jgi:hypothetical protein
MQNARPDPQLLTPNSRGAGIGRAVDVVVAPDAQNRAVGCAAFDVQIRPPAVELPAPVAPIAR